MRGTILVFARRRPCLSTTIVALMFGVLSCDNSSSPGFTNGDGAITDGTGGASAMVDASSGGSSGTGGTTTADAGMGGSIGGVIVHVEGQASNPLPCSSVCATQNLTCVVECKNVGFVFRAAGPVAGWAMYSSKGTGFTDNDDRTTTSCSDAFEDSCGKTYSTKTPWECPPGGLSGSGPPYLLNKYKCCCK